jgi:quercetin dioxygenase-like cupin family protein
MEKGKIRVKSGSGAEELNRGDSAGYRADVPHAIVNIGKVQALVFLVDIYR